MTENPVSSYIDWRGGLFEIEFANNTGYEAATSEGSRESNQDGFITDSKNGYFVVFDGYKDHDQRVVRFLMEEFGRVFAETDEVDEVTLAEKISQINLSLIGQNIPGDQQGRHPGAAFAMAILSKDSNSVLLAHAGDCRIYGENPQGDLIQLMQDQSKGERLSTSFNAGKDHLGEVVVTKLDRSDYKRLILITDGVVKTVDSTGRVSRIDSPTFVSRMSMSQRHPDGVAAGLVHLAVNGDGQLGSSEDNATAIVIDLDPKTHSGHERGRD